MTKLTRDNPYFRQVELLVRVLPIIKQHPCFALKGGTAINLYIQELPRLSVDIDLTYLPLNDRRTALADIRRVLREIVCEIRNMLPGVTAQHLSDKHKLQISSNNIRVKVEVSPVLRGHILQPQTMTVCVPVEEHFGFAEMQVLHPNEIYAGKICAALDRQHPRDLFDIMTLMRNGGITDDLFEVFLIYMLCGNRPIAEMLSPNLIDLEAPFKNQFNGMALIDVTLDELIETRDALLKAIYQKLTDKHKTFLLSFKMMSPNWADTNYPDSKNLPGIKWKLRNIANMSKKKHQYAIERLESVLSGSQIRQ